MIIQLEQGIKTGQVQHIINKIGSIGYKANQVQTNKGGYLICIGKSPFDIRQIGILDGVKDIHRVSDQYKMASKKWKVGYSHIDLGDHIKLGHNHFQIMAGPCSIEDEAQVVDIVNFLAKNQVNIMRGGVYKPRSSPYSFRGLGIEGLKMWYKHTRAHGIKIISEVMQSSQIEDMAPYVDIFQVGARNSQNFNLLDALGQCGRPVMIKRGISGTLDELLYSAEYIFSNGNEDIILCERGIRSYETAYRNTLDLNAIPILKEKTHLPIIADPSHGIGIRRHVGAMALSAVAAGADGIIMEIHPKPENAKSDGQQTLNFLEAQKLINKIRNIRSVVDSF